MVEAMADGDAGTSPQVSLAMKHNERVIVQKYGGSSVADIARIRRVAERVVATKRAGYAVCVVVSAMGKTTDQLLSLAHELSDAPPRRELDMLLSVGERTTMALLAIALHSMGEDAISFTGSQCGILTNDRHFDARIIEVRPFRIEDELARGRIVIVAGYQGMSYKREITTLGRGGSDTTAVALAAGGGGAGARRRALRDLLGRGWRVHGRSARGARGEAHRCDGLRRATRDGGGGREGAQRRGGRVCQTSWDRDLREKDR
jgi:hypothetical protein